MTEPADDVINPEHHPATMILPVALIVLTGGMFLGLFPSFSGELLAGDRLLLIPLLGSVLLLFKQLRDWVGLYSS